MAIWQYKGWVIPLETLNAGLRGQELVEMIREGEPNFWKDQQPGWLAPCAAQLGLIPGSSWHSDITVWGDLESECLSELVEDGKIVDASCKLDARAFNIKRALEFANAFGAHRIVLICVDGKITPPDAWSLYEAVCQSSAGRFVSDPKRYLTSLKDRRN